MFRRGQPLKHCVELAPVVYTARLCICAASLSIQPASGASLWDSRRRSTRASTSALSRYRLNMGICTPAGPSGCAAHQAHQFKSWRNSSRAATRRIRARGHFAGGVAAGVAAGCLVRSRTKLHKSGCFRPQRARLHLPHLRGRSDLNRCSIQQHEHRRALLLSMLAPNPADIRRELGRLARLVEGIAAPGVLVSTMTVILSSAFAGPLSRLGVAPRAFVIHQRGRAGRPAPAPPALASPLPL